jgi:hypothetical protein
MAAQTCLRCGAPVEPDDTVCFNCGAPIGDSKTPTQPVNVPRQITRAAPSSPAATSESVSEARQSTQVLTSRPLPARQAPSAPGAARSSSRWAVLLLGTVALALLAAGAGLALRASLAASPIPKTTVYRDPSHRFSFQRPALWNVTSQPTGVLLTDSDGTSSIQIAIGSSGGDQTATDAANAIATATPGLAGAPQQQIGGQVWAQVSGQVTGSDGAVRQVAVYVTPHAGALYTITCISPLASFATTNNLVFQPLLASFAFG